MQLESGGRILDQNQRQIGYVLGDMIFAGGHGGPHGGKQFGKAEYPQPRLQAAIKMLLG